MRYKHNDRVLILSLDMEEGLITMGGGSPCNEIELDDNRAYGVTVISSGHFSYRMASDLVLDRSYYRQKRIQELYV